MRNAGFRTFGTRDEVGHRHFVVIGSAHVAFGTAFSSLGDRHGTTPSFFASWPARGAATGGGRLRHLLNQAPNPKPDGYLHKPPSTRERWGIRAESLRVRSD